jgi:hypothetical protein
MFHELTAIIQTFFGQIEKESYQTCEVDKEKIELIYQRSTFENYLSSFTELDFIE